eukprot:NODE_58_length_28395_cov_1.465720.p9 type:complete len:358 gc:universal NODE_58_length_28395_cov_1.465720:7022-8095(+)
MLEVLLFSILNGILLILVHSLSSKRLTNSELIFQILTVAYTISMGLYFDYADAWLSALSISILFVPAIAMIKLGYVEYQLQNRYHEKMKSITNDLFEIKKKNEFAENDLDHPVLYVSKVIQSNNVVAFKASSLLKWSGSFILVLLIILFNAPFSDKRSQHFDFEKILAIYSASVLLSLIFLFKTIKKKQFDSLKRSHFLITEVFLELLIFIAIICLYALKLDGLRLLTLGHLTIHHFGIFMFYIRNFPRKNANRQTQKYEEFESLLADTIMYTKFRLYCSRMRDERKIIFLEAYKECESMASINIMKGCSSFAVALSGLELAPKSSSLESMKQSEKRVQRLHNATYEIYQLFLDEGN